MLHMYGQLFILITISQFQVFDMDGAVARSQVSGRFLQILHSPGATVYEPSLFQVAGSDVQPANILAGRSTGHPL